MPCAVTMYNVTLTPYASAPTSNANTITAGFPTPPARTPPRVRLNVPATTPFHKVVWAGVIPSMSAVKWLSNPQQRQPAATRLTERMLAPPSPAAKSSEASNVPPAASQPRFVRCSRNTKCPRITVATNSRFSHRDTVPDLATLSPSRSNSGPRIPPRITAPVSSKSVRRPACHGGRKDLLRMTTGRMPTAAPRYSRPARTCG